MTDGSTLIVEEAGARLDEAAAADEFERKLAAYGYAPLPDYDQPRFVARGVRTYLVGDAFPRLAKSELPAGVHCVSYHIRLEAIEAFKCEELTVFGGA